jgi:hypothetical protein
MQCRSGCGACCIAASINNPLPGMPGGKPAGTACVNLDPMSYRCRIWGTDDYPAVCRDFRPEPAVCGVNRGQALQLIALLEDQTTA